MILTYDDLCDVEVDGIDTEDYPDFCDAFISAAPWKSSGNALTDEELEEVNDLHFDVVYEAVTRHLW